MDLYRILVFSTTSYQPNRTRGVSIHHLYYNSMLLLQDKGYNYVFTTNRLNNSDFNIADLFL